VLLHSETPTRTLKLVYSLFWQNLDFFLSLVVLDQPLLEVVQALVSSWIFTQNSDIHTFCFCTTLKHFDSAFIRIFLYSRMRFRATDDSYVIPVSAKAIFILLLFILYYSDFLMEFLAIQ